MLDTRIKVCGITSPADAKLASSHGADYLGLIFAKSPRRVTVEAARNVREAVPNAMLVGVFVDAPIDDVAATARACGLDLVQLHGKESPEYCDALHAQTSLPIIKVFSASQLDGAERLKQYKRTSYFLFDLDKGDGAREQDKVQGAHDDLWQRADALRRRGYRIFLAGGLDER
jgi:phosphoribosylanthranilate isomerase